MVPTARRLNCVYSVILAVITKLLVQRAVWDVYCQELNSNPANLSSLRLVHMLYRHGDRSSIHGYPNDNYTEADWPQGYGQLTQIGMRQHYELGKYIRQRYQGFLSEHYNRSEIHIRSTDFDRTLMSAYSHLAGLYPPEGRQLWNESIPWQPIPVHTVPQDEDYLMLMNNCPVAAKSGEEFQHSEILKKQNVKYKTFIERVANLSGVGANFSAVAGISDVIFCEMNHNMSQPSWVLQNNTFRTLRQLLAFSQSYSYYAKVAKRLYGGPLLKEFIEHMKNRTDKNNNMTEKLFMYSGHDSTVIALMKVLNVYDHVYNQVHHDGPNYTAMVIVELHEKKTEQYFVEVYFKNGEYDPDLHLLTIPGCKPSCPFNKFILLTKDYIPDDIKKECGVVEGTFHANSWIAGILLGCLLSLIIVILGMLIVLYCKYRRRRKLRYHALAVNSLDDDDDDEDKLN